MVESLFSQYANYPTHEIVLEVIATLFGLWSVIFAKRNNILVFPAGIISTSIYVYLLWQWSLLGDMLINGYYFIMSIIGWIQWQKKSNEVAVFPISFTNKKEKYYAALMFVLSVVFVIVVYNSFDKFNTVTAYVDTLTTGLFFTGMWLMTRRKIENWIFWIIGDIISVPLYFYKGYTITSIQYVVFTIIAIYGYVAWNKMIQKNT